MQLTLTDFITQHPNNAYQAALKELRLQLITDALNLCDQNHSKTAELLGVTRTTLREWVRMYNL